VKAEIAAAISGEARAKSAKPSSAPTKAKERPLSSPTVKQPAPALARPEPRVATPRAAPQPPPRRKKSTSQPSKADSPAGAPTIPARSATAVPPPLPSQKAPVIEPPPPSAPAAAPPIPPPSTVAVGEAVSVKAIKPAPKPAAAVKEQEHKSDEPTAPVVRGVEHDPAKRLTVYLLGLALSVLALASSYPAVMEIVRHVRDPLSPGVENWAYLALLVCGIQLIYAFYLVQLPDWSSVWVTMIATSLVAVFYAVGMGMSLMARPDNELLAMLGLTSWHAAGHLSLWCLLLTLLTALLSYAMVRTSVRWQKMFELAMAHTEE
jgi:hypothetical protein